MSQQYSSSQQNSAAAEHRRLKDRCRIESNNAKHYLEERNRRYHGQWHPEEVEPYYDHYSEISQRNDGARRRYFDAETRHRDDVKGRDVLEREYYDFTAAGIRPDGHKELHGLATTLATLDLRY